MFTCCRPRFPILKIGSLSDKVGIILESACVCVCVCGMLRCAVRLHDDYLRNRHKRLLSSCIHYSLLPGDILVFIFIAVSNPTGSSFSTQCPARKENPASAKIRRCRTGRTRCLACIATGPSKCVPGLLLITKKKKLHNGFGGRIGVG